MTEMPITLTGRTRRVRGHLGAVGPVAVLRAAFDSRELLTLGGKYAGERVALGHTRQTYGDYGITLERIGLDYEVGEHPDYPGISRAVYLLDLTRLADAPRIAEMVRQVEGERTARMMAAEQAAAEEERRYLDQWS